MGDELYFYAPQVAAMATGLVTALTRIPRDLPRPFGIVTVLVGLAAFLLMKRSAAEGCFGDGACDEGLVWVGLLGWAFSGILALTIFAASTADMIRFLGQRRRSEGGRTPKE